MLARNRVLVLAVAVASLSAVAGAVPTLATADLSSREGIAEQVRALGFDPATTVVQRSVLNYAGPDCPGAGWSCVSVAGPVVQISSGGINIFEAGGGSSHGHSCSVSQTNTTGPNNASCSLSTSDNGVTQTAHIVQTNSSGVNNAAINLAATIQETQSGVSDASFDQTFGQQAAVFQTNGSGRNNATIEEDLSMRAQAISVGGGTSMQDSIAVAVLDQDSGSGRQDAEIVQNHRLFSDFTGGSGGEEIEIAAVGEYLQEQQTRATDRNIVVFANQESGGGINDLDLAQSQTMRMTLDGVTGDSTESQGNELGGMIGDIQQDSISASSHYDADIFKEMIADPDAGTVLQLEDPNCCDILGLSPSTPTTCTIDITVRILGPDHAEQDAFLRGRAFAESNCDVLLSLLKQAGKTPIIINEQRSGTFVDVTIDCEGGECSSGDSPPDPSGPAGNLHLSIRNKTQNEAFSRTDPQKPYFTDGLLSDVFEIKLEFHNHTSSTINNLVLSIPVPPGTTFASCSGCVGGAPQGGTVVFDRGTVLAGKKAVGIFRVRPAISGFFSSAGSFSSSLGSAASNPVWYLLS